MIFISILILIMAKAIPFISKNISSIFYNRISTIVLIYAGVLSINTLNIQSIGSGIGIYNGLFHVTIISQILEVFLLIIGAIILISWPLITNFNFKNTNTQIYNLNSEYSLIILFSTLGSLLLISSSDLITLYLGIELQSFGLYVLTSLNRESELSTSAGLKYFLLGSLASCIILLGSGLVYAYSGITNFESLYTLMLVTSNTNIIQGINIGLIFILIGFLFKIAAAPLHNWSPDVYDESPTIITIWLTIMPKIAIIVFLIELLTPIDYFGKIFEHYLSLQIINPVNDLFNNTILEKNQIINSLTDWISIIINNIKLPLNDTPIKNLLLISSLLSLIIGTVVGLAQTKIKRLLAYSTISHIGYMLLGLAINTQQSINSLIFYLIQYIITNLNTFLILLAFSYILIKPYLENNNTLSIINKETNKNINNKNENNFAKNTDINYLSELKGQFFNNPILSLSLTICLFSMAGTPPLIGFFSKQFILYSAIDSGYYFMAVLGIIVSVISASYYIKIIKILHTESSVKPILTNSINTNNTINNTLNVLTSSLNTSNSNQYLKLSNFHSLIISFLTLTILLFVLKPSIILNISELLALSIFKF